MSSNHTLLWTFFFLTIYINLVSGKIVSSYHPPSGQSTNYLKPQQTEIKPKWSISNLNSDETQDLEKLVEKNLEQIFTKEEFSNFGSKTSPVQEASDGNPNDLSSPDILKVPVPQPYPVHIPVKQPFTVPIFKLVPKEVEKKVLIPVEKLVPVYKEKPVEIVVEKHHPVAVYKPYPVPVPVNTHILLGQKDGYSTVPVGAHAVIGNEKEQYNSFKFVI